MIKRKTAWQSRVALAALLAIPGSVTMTAQGWAQLDEIVVTTRKREENLQDLPIAVTALSDVQLQRSGIVDLDDITKFSPSVIFDRSFGPSDTRITLRGLSNRRGRSNVAFLVDGVDVTTENLISAGSGLLANQRLLSDVERVELVKGPQSALYGRAAFAGAISYVTKEPGDEFESQIGFEIAEFNQYQVDGAIGGPVVEDKLGLRLNALYWNEDGTYNNSVSGDSVGGGEGWAISATSVFTPTDELKFKLRASYSDDEYDPLPTTHIDGDTFFGFPRNAVDIGGIQSGDGPTVGLAEFRDGIFLPTTFGDADGRSIAHSEDALTGEDYEGTTIEVFRLSFQADWDLDFGTLTSITGWTDAETTDEYDQDYQAVGRPDRLFGSQQAKFATNTRQFSQELRFQSDWDGPIQTTLGAYYWEESRDARDQNFIIACLDRDFPAGGDARVAGVCDGTGGSVASWQEFAIAQGEVPETPFSADTYHWSWYGMVEWEITDQFKATAETRYVDEDFFVRRANFSACTNLGFAVFLDPAVPVPLTADEAVCPIANENLDPEDPFSPRPILIEGDEDSKFHTPKLTLEWTPNDDILVYASVAKAQKPGGINVLSAGGSPATIDQLRFDPEKMIAWELGTKTSWDTSAGFFQLNGAAFFQDYSDKQTSSQIVAPDGTLQPVVKNASGAEVWGVELDFTWQPPIEGLTLSAGYTWLDAEYTDFVDETRSLQRATAQQSCPLVYKVSDETSESIPIPDQATATALEASLGADFDDSQYFCQLDFAGARLERTPEHSFVASFNYTQPLSNTNFEWFVEGNTNYQSDRFVDFDNAVTLEDYWNTDLRVGVQSDRIDLLVYVENVFDDDTIKTGGVGPEFADQVRDFGFTAGLGVNHWFVTLPDPRTVGIRGKLRF